MGLKYSYDSLGAPEELIEDEARIVGVDWNEIPIQEGEKVYSFEALTIVEGKREYVDKYFKYVDIFKFLKTLEKEDLFEILENVDADIILDAGNMEEVYL